MTNKFDALVSEALPPERKVVFIKVAPARGLANVVNPFESYKVKTGGKTVGSITYDIRTSARPKGTDKWIARFTVATEPTKENPSPFKWIRLKTAFDTPEEAKSFIQRFWNSIQKYNLYPLDI